MMEFIPEWLVALPFVASLVLFGMPHGAADGALGLRWARERSRPMLWLFGVFVLYSVVIVLTAGVLVTIPELGLLLFLMIAVGHFGISASRLYPWDDALSGMATGAVVVCLPFAIHFEATRDVFTAASRMLGGPDFPSNFAMIAGSIGVLGGVIALGLHGFRIISGLLERGASGVRMRRGVAGAAVVLAIVLVHALLPPLMSVGVCFLAWHAVPETVRIGRVLGRHDVWSAIVRTHSASLAFLVPTLLAMGALVVVYGVPMSLPEIGVATIVAYAVLTPGHFAFQELLVGRREAA